MKSESVPLITHLPPHHPSHPLSSCPYSTPCPHIITPLLSFPILNRSNYVINKDPDHNAKAHKYMRTVPQLNNGELRYVTVCVFQKIMQIKTKKIYLQTFTHPLHILFLSKRNWSINTILAFLVLRFTLLT